ncbi:MAG: hypothetical protein ACO1SV_18215 [Fimbriimonas sp.]
MVMDTLESGTPTTTGQSYDWLLTPSPRLRGLVPTLSVAAVITLPLALVAGFIVTGRPVDGLYAVPLLCAATALRLNENLG